MDRENKPRPDSDPLIKKDIPLEVLARSLRIRAQTLAEIECTDDDPINQYLDGTEAVDYPTIGRRLYVGISGIGAHVIPEIVSKELKAAREALGESVTNGVRSNEARIIDIIEGEVARTSKQTPEKTYAYNPSQDQNSQIGLPYHTRGRIV